MTAEPLTLSSVGAVRHLSLHHDYRVSNLNLVPELYLSRGPACPTHCQTCCRVGRRWSVDSSEHFCCEELDLVLYISLHVCVARHPSARGLRKFLPAVANALLPAIGPIFSSWVLGSHPWLSFPLSCLHCPVPDTGAATPCTPPCSFTLLVVLGASCHRTLVQ